MASFSLQWRASTKKDLRRLPRDDDHIHVSWPSQRRSLMSRSRMDLKN